MSSLTPVTSLPVLLKMELCTQNLALPIMEKLWLQILVLCSMKMELCTQILALTIMEKLCTKMLPEKKEVLSLMGVKHSKNTI